MEKSEKMLCADNVLSIIDSWPFQLRVKVLKSLIYADSVYVATSDGREEFIESGQVIDNEQSGMIIIQLKEI